ncbi:DNA mismatch repair endonuclease MutL [Pseudoflavonifractor phocaeensis]|uniref:DNA mismatch repair endonuclease MutL n=1 Tax=Pseudoflavonifractor phocaeensis TaxID=1870988 RepID=UPI00195CC43D|nr:DNA mismatch repair endonuclease MutL [Pseudoflavonifractor phocaeensis]MBM6925697.1 DNA mismatch repair endonuclease MutL [Pseudoflavonifractor phocaeensis]
MPHIQQLDPHVADLIAAGEVVERPASVVKELMENAIDAGADKLTVEIQHGGMTLIRVTDNGCGIAAGEAETAFLRHATSKLRTEYDLEAIGTLGFRGEALAAISAVSRIQLLTRTNREELGTALSLEGGLVVDHEEAGCPQGTTMVVKDLFYNTPARLKFMKKDAYEGAACFAMAQRVALSHPEVSVKFLRDGRQELLTPGDGQLKSALYAVLGRDLALGFTPVRGSGEDMSVSGFVSLPTCCRGSRGYQHFFVNGRYVKSRTMMAALEEAYANQKMVGKFPGCVLHLTTRLNAVDVNVHPTKQEVKFGSEKKVFDAVYYAVKSTLEADRSRPAALGEEPPRRAIRQADTVTPNQTAFRTMTAEQFRKAADRGGGSLPLHDFTAPGAGRQTTQAALFPERAGHTLCAPTEGPDKPDRSEPLHPRAGLRPAPTEEQLSASPVGAGHRPAQSPPLPADGGRPQAAPTAGPNKPDQSAPLHPRAGLGPAPTEGQPSVSPVEAGVPDGPCNPASADPVPEEIPWRLAGEVLNTYIIVEQGDKVLLIDKHAAHERMNFDRLKAAGYRPMVQTLLTPVVFTPPAEEGAALLARLPLLERFGFEAEDFGGGALIVRTAPDDVAAGAIPDLLLELAGKLLTCGTADPEAARDALLHTMACKAAIKGGQKNGEAELRKVAEAVMAGTVKYCPHGRPVAIELTRQQIEKRFGRA